MSNVNELSTVALDRVFWEARIRLPFTHHRCSK